MRFLTVMLAFVSATALSAQVRVDPDKSEWFAYDLVQPQGSHLGIKLSDIDADRASALKLGEPRGVEITEVSQGSPAEKAGIKAGDVILAYNGENILGAQQLGRLVRETPIGRRVRVQFWRDGKTQTTTAITEGLRARQFDMPGDMKDFTTHVRWPDMRTLVIPEIPTPLMLWNSTLLGVECEEVNAQLADYFGVKHGVLVRSVTKGSPAEKAGLKAGDVLVSIGDRSINNAHDLTGFFRTRQEQEKPISIALMREHREMTLNVTPRQNSE